MGEDAAAVRAERHDKDTNVFYWPGSRDSRRRLLRLDFWHSGPVYLRVYGPGGNQDLVGWVRLWAVGDIVAYAGDIRAAAFRGCGGA